MSLKGDLHSVPLGDVLQTLFQNEKEGTLKLKCPEYTKFIYCCPSGITLLEPEILQKRRFGDIVVSAGLTERATIEQVLTETESLMVGEALVQAGIIDQQALDRILKIQVEDELFSLFDIHSGEFEFFENDKGSPSAEEKGLPLFQVEGVVFEAARRMDEWSYIRQFVDDLDSVYLQNPGAVVQEPEVLPVWERIDGRRTVRNISDSLLSSPFEVAKIMANLVEESKVRTAEKHELLGLAQDLIDESDINRAGTILKKLRPNLKNIVLGEEDVSSLADLFYKVGDILTATNILLTKVRQAQDDSLHEESIPFLKQAHKIAPEDPRILKELAKVSQNAGDMEGRIQYLSRMVQVYMNEEQYEAAVRVCDEILEVDRKNAVVIDKLPECLILSGNKDGAVEFLEDMAESLGKKADPAVVVGIYRKIIKIDPTRKDVSDKLKKAQRKAHNQNRRLIHLAGLTIILLGGVMSWFVNNQEGQTDMDRVGLAALKFAQNDPRGAQTMLQGMMDTLEDAKAKQQAQDLLESIDNRLRQGERMSVEIESKQYYERIKRCHELVGQGRFDEAIEDLKSISADFDPMKYGKNTHDEVTKIVKRLTKEIPSLRNEMAEFEPPSVEEEVEEVYHRFSPVLPPEKVETLNSLVPLLKELANDEVFGDAVTDDLINQVETAALEADQFLNSLDELEVKLTRLKSLADLSSLYAEAEKAEKDGRLDKARELYGLLVEGYGEGKMKEEFQRRESDLNDFFDTLERISKSTDDGKIEKAYAMATELLDRHDDDGHADFVQVPVLITSVPAGASIRSQGRNLGTAPKLIHLHRDQSMNIALEHEGYEQAYFVIDRHGGAQRRLTLNRKALFKVKLGGIIEGVPLLNDAGLILASRSGDIFRVDPDNGDILKKYSTRSLSGIASTVIEAHDHLYFNTIEGELWQITTTSLEQVNKTELSAGTRCPPLAAPEGIVTASLDGQVVNHAPDLAAQRWTYTGPGKILVDPLIMNDLLIVAFATGEIVGLELGDGREALRFKSGTQSIAGIASLDDLVFLCSQDGWVKALDTTTNEPSWFTDLDSFIKHPPTVSSGKIIVVANKKIVFLDAADGRVMESCEMSETVVMPPALIDGALCFGTKDGNLHYRPVDADEDLWIYRTTDSITAPPLMTRDYIFITDKEGRLSAIFR